jgi:hypothetical protein
MIPVVRTMCGVVAMILGFLLGTGGCGGETVKKAADAVKKQTSKAGKSLAAAVQESTRPTKTSIKLQVAGQEKPVEITNGSALVAALAGRPVLINVQTLTGTGNEYPKFFLTAQAPGGAAADLVGKSLDASIYYQEKPHLALYSTPLDKPAKVLLEAADEAYVQLKLENAELIDPSAQLNVNLTGSVVALVPQPKVKETPKADEAKEKKKGPVSAADKIKAAEESN